MITTIEVFGLERMTVNALLTTPQYARQGHFRNKPGLEIRLVKNVAFEQFVTLLVVNDVDSRIVCDDQAHAHSCFYERSFTSVACASRHRLDAEASKSLC